MTEQERMAHALARLAGAVVAQVPRLHYRVEYWQNDAFPWCLQLRCIAPAPVVGETNRIVDAEVECLVTPQGWRVTADVCRVSTTRVGDEDALILTSHSSDVPEKSVLEATLAGVEAFLTGQADLIVNVLSSPAK